MTTSLPTTTKKRRAYWTAELAKLSGVFGDDSTKLLKELNQEIKSEGPNALLDHLRICGALPEFYGHDSSEEKLYSKYTDAVVSETLSAIGLKSIVITTRADAADVQAAGQGISLVADAKAFRLSRTAKNQKDFKIQAMDNWRGAQTYAMVVGPIYQLPSRISQIYLQAIARNVCILSYTHLAAIVRLTLAKSPRVGASCLSSMLKCVSVLQPTKSASDYWQGVNCALIKSLGALGSVWTEEKTMSMLALDLAKAEALEYLRKERDRILKLTHQQALTELVRLTGVESRISQISRITHGGLLDV